MCPIPRYLYRCQTVYVELCPGERIRTWYCVIACDFLGQAAQRGAVWRKSWTNERSVTPSYGIADFGEGPYGVVSEVVMLTIGAGSPIVKAVWSLRDSG